MWSDFGCDVLGRLRCVAPDAFGSKKLSGHAQEAIYIAYMHLNKGVQGCRQGNNEAKTTERIYM